jgi:signal peptidase I
MLQSLKKILSFLIFDVLETLVIALAIFVVIYVFIASPHIIVGDSMNKDFSNGEFLLVNKLAYRIGNPQRGDVIVFKFDPTHDYIKRIIGLPGDTVSLYNGRVYVDGNVMNEGAYVSKGNYSYGLDFLQEDHMVKVPKDEYFVMGDNREESSDSRQWGFVKRSAIDGKAWIIYWPVKNLELVPGVTYTNHNSSLTAVLN